MVELKWHPLGDFLETAQIIKGSKLFIGNQSVCFSIAEAMKHPRILEVFHKNSNCMPSGADGYVHLDNNLLETYL